ASRARTTIVRIPLAAPDIEQSDIDAVVAVLRTPRLSLGPQLVTFEAQLSTWVGARQGVAVSSGTTGLHLALQAVGVATGDEVITSPLSFVASANAILHQNAIPVFVDVDPVTLNIDPSAVESAITPHTRAILVVHLLGRPADIANVL